MWFKHTQNGVFACYCRAIAACFATSRLDHFKFNLLLSEVSHCANVVDPALPSQTSPIFNRCLMISFSQSLHTLHTFLSSSYALCINNYMLIFYILHMKIYNSPWCSSKLHNLLMLCSSIFNVRFYCIFYTVGSIISMASSTLFVSQDCWHTQSSEAFESGASYCTLCESHFLTHSSSIYTCLWEFSRH